MNDSGNHQTISVIERSTWFTAKLTTDFLSSTAVHHQPRYSFHNLMASTITEKNLDQQPSPLWRCQEFRQIGQIFAIRQGIGTSRRNWLTAMA
ncbi:MAG: hypothetical protein DWI02_12965 [Planctomycetota bacterium]|nr:MAG: hypothetical protein DWI02_12965 [Planctomycetota bacterium]